MTARSPSVTIVYDGECGFCVRSMHALRALDLLGRLRFLDGSRAEHAYATFPELAGADLTAAMYAVTGCRAYRGFDAFRRAMWVCPVLAPFVPLLYLPGIRWVGVRVYGWVARNRRAFGCSPGACHR